MMARTGSDHRPAANLDDQSSPMRQTGAMADLAELARTTLSRNRFMVLGTVDPSGRPRVSPVWVSVVAVGLD